MTAPKPEIRVLLDNISPQHKATALKAAQEMPINGTLEEKSEFIWDELVIEHPDFEWGV
jgi:hypothetical protein